MYIVVTILLIDSIVVEDYKVLGLRELIISTLRFSFHVQVLSEEGCGLANWDMTVTHKIIFVLTLR